jgi:hypothetical protein
VAGWLGGSVPGWMDEPSGECSILPNNLLKGNLCELNTCPDELLVFFDTALFLEK